MRFADLHLHTSASDGTYSVSQLISESKKAGLYCIAIADHDTVEAIEPALAIAAKEDIEILPAIEFTSEFNSLEVHILGYLIDYKNEPLLKQLGILRKNRIERIYKIVDKLKGLGVKLDPQSVFKLSSCGTVGRLHIARAMVQEEKVNSIFEAFQKYIGDECPAYVLGFRLSAQDAISLIKDAGGVPVLAHPYLLKNDELIKDFIKYGIMGLEVYYPEHSQSMVNFYRQFAEEHNLVVTGGSDCHGTAKPDVKIGSVKLPYELVEKLKEAREHLL